MPSRWTRLADAQGEITRLRTELVDMQAEYRKVELLWKGATIDRDAALRDLARAMQGQIDFAIAERDAKGLEIERLQQVCLQFSDTARIQPEYALAALHADWEQVRQNGGPPCFHIKDQRFCLRAESWAGHGSAHQFTTLHAALSGSPPE